MKAPQKFSESAQRDPRTVEQHYPNWEILEVVVLQNNNSFHTEFSFPVFLLGRADQAFFSFLYLACSLHMKLLGEGRGAMYGSGALCLVCSVLLLVYVSDVSLLHMCVMEEDNLMFLNCPL